MVKERKINFSAIEKKWQKKWEEKKIFQVSMKKSKKKFYVLEMFPYPSGSGLHMGHAWNYVIGDIFARFKMMQGFNVLHPMGYDSLGLPAENAAIKAGENPEDYTKKSVANFTKQFKSLGLSYDWTRVVNTSSPSYYKWDQWIFLKMFEKGLAYQKTSSVNWCPKCNTVLANEQVVDGCCWRHEDTKVVIKHLKQWFLKITDYADELLQGHEKLNWPSKTIAMQKNWIGKSHGTEIDFEILGEKWPIFTTRPDTIYGVTFMVISAQHPRLFELVTNGQKKDVDEFLKKIKTTSQKTIKDLEELDKQGVFTGSYAVNPINNERIPIWVGNFVVADYGSGMVMAVPAHDQRDFDFAKKYGIKIKKVIKGKVTDNRAYTVQGTLTNSGKFNGLEGKEAMEKITEWLEKKKLGKKTVNYKLRDWGISRQRYWGTPIPIIYCDKCGIVSVPEKDLPVKLPKKVKFGKGNPLETAKNWLKVKCPKCGAIGKRETDTMDTFVNSSWYFLRYTDNKNKKKIFDKKKANYWMPVDLYIGGKEHACMHLIYCRFYTKFLRDLGLLKIDEPTPRLFHQGVLAGEGGVKMSKSKPETCVLPELVSDKYGIDTARFFLSSLASPDKDMVWSDKGIEGSMRFVNKVMNFKDFGKTSNFLKSKLNKTIKLVTEDIDKFKYNLAVIKLRDFFNSIDKISKKDFSEFLKLLSVFCPHICEELWHKLGNKDFISIANWPKPGKINEKLLKQEEQVDNLIKDIKNILNILQDRNQKPNQIKVFAIPSEVSIYKKAENKIKISFGLDVQVLSIKDAGKTGKKIKAKPGKPGILIS